MSGVNADGAARSLENGAGPARHPGAVTLAAELRALRERAGSPSYRQLAKATNFSASTLAEATAGRRLPTEQVIRALAKAYGDDPDRWAAKLREAARLTQLTPRAATPAVPALPSGDPLPPSTIRILSRLLGRPTAYGLAALLLAASGFAVGAVTMGRGADPTARTATGSSLTSGSAPASALSSAPAPDGADPITAGCTRDGQLVDKVAVMNHGEQIGALELKYSRRCGAGWSRVYLYPVGVKPFSDTMTEVEVEALDETATSFTGPLHNNVPNYTGVIQPHGGCLRARAQLRPAGRAPINVTIACDALPEITPSHS
jgi:transcriptional regulator with XRE-family HTH domain